MYRLLTVAGIFAVYWLPGHLYLRRLGLRPLERIAIAVGLSSATMVFLMTVAAATVGVTAVSVALSVSVLLVFAYARPLRAGSIESVGSVGPWGYGTFALLTTTGLAYLYSALAPRVFKLWDALTIWAPLADTISVTGDATPLWLPTRIAGFPPSISLIASAPRALSGDASSFTSYVTHPAFAVLALAGAALVATSVADRRAGLIAVLALLFTPLIGRGVFFHDDLVVAAFVVLSLFVALRARSPEAWAIAGVLAGAAISTKHLGVVAIGVVAIAWLATRAPVRSLFAAAAGVIVGSPWYIWTWIRLGNPVFPFLPFIFGSTPESQLMHEDTLVFLQNTDRSNFEEIGWLALGVLAVGFVMLIWSSLQTKAQQSLWLAALFLGYSLTFIAAWYFSGYASRHLLILLVPAFGLAGAGLSLAPKAFRDHAGLLNRLASGIPVLLVVALLAATTFAVRTDLDTGMRADLPMQTGVYAIAKGKWPSIASRIGFDGDDRLRAIHGDIANIWETLDRSAAGGVLSYDTRTYYFPQVVFDGNDTRLGPVYYASDTFARHEALTEMGIAYVLSRPFGKKHALTYPLGPWEDLAAYPALYELVLKTSNASLYRVVKTQD